MTFKADERIYETSTTVGTGTYTLDGAQVGYQAFSVLTAGNDCPYFATNDTDWEVGIGTVLAGPSRLQRTTILASSNAGAAVNWAAGTRKIRCAWPAWLALPRYLTKSVAGGVGTTVLTSTEQRGHVLEFTGALTGNRIIEVDPTPWEWTVYNNTSGAFALTLRVTGQTGVSIPQGKRVRALCDGTDVRNSVSDFAGGSLSTGAITSTGLIDISSSGAGQIKFPGTQNASANVNTLDDYEEGTWTPSIGGTATYSNQVGTYIKIGRLVHVNCQIQINAIGTSGGSLAVSGLPFSTSSSLGSLGAPYWGSAANTFVDVLCQMGGSGFTIVATQAASVSSGVPSVNFFAAGTIFFVNGGYETAN